MFKNYLKITWRNLLRHKGYAFINIFGLAVGIAFCALLLLYVRDELTFDHVHQKADQLYRVHEITYNPAGEVTYNDVYLPLPLGPALQTDFPDVARFARLFEERHFVQHIGDAVEEVVLYADPALLEMFTFPLKQGDPATALSHINNVVLTERTARKYFGDQNPIGQTLEIRLENGFDPFIVSGVAEDMPGNSSVWFDILLPFDKLIDGFEWIRNGRVGNWNGSSFYTYVELNPGSTLAADAERLLSFRETYYPNEREELRTEGRWEGDGAPASYGLQPLHEVHLNPDIPGGITPASNPMYSYILFGIAMAVLLIACINFMTLSLGKSASRAREVGIRKVVGAQRKQLIGQFWGEAVFLSFLAMLVGLALAEILLPTFNTLAGKSLAFDYVANWQTGLMLIGLMGLTGLIAGSYPALVLSGFKPIHILKQTLRLGGANTLTRSLVVFQFGLSVFLMITTLVMLNQLSYLQNKPLGFDDDQVVVIRTLEQDGDKALAHFRQVLADQPRIQAVSGASFSLGYGKGWSRTGFMYKDELKRVYEYRVEPDYADLMGLELIAGRNFNPLLSSDTTHAIIVNEALVKHFGWTDPIGEVLSGLNRDPANDPVVIGVVKDYNFMSLHQEIGPVMLYLNPNHARINDLLVRIDSEEIAATLDVLKSTWAAFSPELPFQYSFLDEDLHQYYQAEQRWSRIVGYSTLFAVLIACLGLFGLAALSAAGRTKEVGIRKVMGASVAGLTMLLTRDFAKLVAIGVILATPPAYWAIQRWLEGFAYRIELSWSLFGLAGLLALGIAILTVGFQSVKAALGNPVDALRYE